MRRTAYMLWLMATLLLLSAALSGCAFISSGVIKENAGEERLPAIDPQAGVARDIKVKLYYRLTDEAYLVGVTGAVTVLSNERPEKAIIRALIDGTPPLSNNISPVFPEGTDVVDVTLDGAILYVTLSEAFFDASLVNEAVSDGTRLLESNLIGKTEYDQRVAAAREEMYLKRKLAIYSMANTITEYESGVRIQFLFQIGENTVRVSRAELGLESYADAESDLLEPIGAEGSLMVNPQIIVECALNRISRGEYQKAYDLFAETESGGVQKPDYANFEMGLSQAVSVAAYTVKGYTLSEDKSYAYVTVDLLYRIGEDGRERRQRNLTLMLKSEGSIYKLGYQSLISVFGGNTP